MTTRTERPALLLAGLALVVLGGALPWVVVRERPGALPASGPPDPIPPPPADPGEQVFQTLLDETDNARLGALIQKSEHRRALAELARALQAVREQSLHARGDALRRCFAGEQQALDRLAQQLAAGPAQGHRLLAARHLLAARRRWIEVRRGWLEGRRVQEQELAAARELVLAEAALRKHQQQQPRPRSTHFAQPAPWADWPLRDSRGMGLRGPKLAGKLKGVALRKIVSAPYFVTDLADPGDGSGRLILATQKGKLHSFDPRSGRVDPSPVFDLTSRVVMKFDMGLLAIAFHPRYRANRRFYLYYNARFHKAFGYVSRLSEFRMSGTPAQTERVLFELPSQVACRRGGGLAFGPDGLLYVGTGSLLDPFGAQKLSSLAGKILRLDTDRRDKGLPYAIPYGNPFSGSKERREIWATGFRNPFRLSFDRDGSLWVADNGEHHREEINLVRRGEDHGWPWREGSLVNPGLSWKHRARASQTASVEPIWEYENPPGRVPRAVIGGHVYRGKQIPALRGWYVFGDHGSCEVLALLWDPLGKRVVDVRRIAQLRYAPAAFCRDGRGELYLATYAPAALYKLVAE